MGKMLINSSLFTYMMNFHKDIWVPVVSWYVRAGDKHVLIDTGAPPDIMGKRWYNDYEELASFEAALEAVGTAPDAIDIVIQTHLHFDHCGNLPECKNAEVIVQEEELSFSRKPHPLFYGGLMVSRVPGC